LHRVFITSTRDRVDAFLHRFFRLGSFLSGVTDFSLKKAPAWMRFVLLAAGVYNLLWGAFAVIFPNALFDWLSMERPNYPQFWQCIGMIVGVYGLGYVIAAFDPIRHWPIVFVGFLGKIFGPLGMAQALWTGALPWAFAINCVTNDLIWWIPFGLILKFALGQHLAEPGAREPADEASLLNEALTNQGETLAGMSHRQTLLVVFLRTQVAHFAARRWQISRKDGRRSSAREALWCSSTWETKRRSMSSQGATGWRMCPPSRIQRGDFTLVWGLRRGRWWQLLGPRVWWRGA